MVINQIIQESVPENERGVVGGVQGSINKIFDLIKYVCVISLPGLSTYGYLVMVSVSAVFVAFCLYLVYCIKVSSQRYIQVPVKDTSGLPLNAKNEDNNQNLRTEETNIDSNNQTED